MTVEAEQIYYGLIMYHSVPTHQIWKTSCIPQWRTERMPIRFNEEKCQTMKIIIVESDISTNYNLQLLLEGEPSTEWTLGYETVERAIEQAPWDEATILLTDVSLFRPVWNRTDRLGP